MAQLSPFYIASASIAEAPDYLNFLRNAAEEINSSLDYTTTLRNVAQTMVPYLSDWCAVDILQEDGQLQRVAIAHKDPSKIKLAEELSRKYPPDPEASNGSAKVVRTGEPVMTNDITDAMVVAAAQDDEHLRLMRALHFHSVLIYPLRSRAKILGTLTFVWTESKRKYSLTDIAFVETLSVIAGSAIENTRLINAITKQ
jgi:GAF domain-containing protein